MLGIGRSFLGQKTRSVLGGHWLASAKGCVGVPSCLVGRSAFETVPCETGEDILTFDVSDEALERAAAVTEGRAMTIAYCTHWYECGWPL
jgi:hypothetical protein